MASLTAGLMLAALATGAVAAQATAASITLSHPVSGSSGTLGQGDIAVDIPTSTPVLER